MNQSAPRDIEIIIAGAPMVVSERVARIIGWLIINNDDLPEYGRIEFHVKGDSIVPQIQRSYPPIDS